PVAAALTAQAGSTVGFQAGLAGSSQAGGLTATWWVDGVQVKAVAAAHGQSPAFNYAVTDGLLHKVELKVRDNTRLVLETPVASKVWMVQGVASVPGTPTITALTSSWSAITMTFAAPASTGGSPLTGYASLCTSPGRVNVMASAKASPIVMKRLPIGVTYACTVAASNALGKGPSSAPRSVKTRLFF
ncbi:MAG: fibronectin type III domain-containing protein, partial [Pseudomonadota bacterium]